MFGAIRTISPRLHLRRGSSIPPLPLRLTQVFRLILRRRVLTSLLTSLSLNDIRPVPYRLTAEWLAQQPLPELSQQNQSPVSHSYIDLAPRSQISRDQIHR